MRRRRAGLVGILALALAASCGDERQAATPLAAAPAPSAPAAASAPATAAPEAPKALADTWYRTLEDGQPSGWRHVKWTRSSYEGRPTIHDRTESYSRSTRQMGGEADIFESRSYGDVERTEDGLLWRYELRELQGERMSDSVQVWTGRGYELTKHDAGGEEKHAVACDAPCPIDCEAFLSTKLRAGEVVVGQKYEYKAPNFLGKRLDTVSLRVEAKETVSLPAGEFECFRVVESVEGVPAEATWWLDGTGVVRKLRAGNSQVLASTERLARDLSDGGAVYSITVPSNPDMARCTSLDRAVIDVTLAPREGVELPDFPATPFSRELSRDGNTIRVELLAHDEAPGDVKLPVTDPQLAKHLERTNLFCWDSPRVKAALAEAVGDETDPPAVVKKLLRYVFVTLRKQSGPTPEPTAVEILEEGRGDCSEHCALFVTLCRAAGIPSRRMSGYAQVGDMWGSHSFAEVWLGRWIGCDPTTNEFGTKARYLAFGWNDDADSFPGVVSSRISGRIAIRTVEFTEGGRTFRTEGLVNPSELEDVLSGIAFAAPPEGWRAGVGAPGHGRATGPGVRAEVSVIAGYGDIPCDVLRREMFGGWKAATFGGRDALRDDMTVRDRANVQLIVPYKRRMLSVRVHVDDPSKVDAALADVATLLGPTFD